MDIALDPTTNDLDLSAGGDLYLISGTAAIAQQIGIRLRTYQGELFFAADEGMPYLESVLVRPVNLPLVETLYRDAILSVPGVLDIVEYDQTLDSTRTLSVTFRALVTDGVVDYSFTTVIG